MIPLQAIKLLLPKSPTRDIGCWADGDKVHMKFMNETFMVDVILPALSHDTWAGSLHMYSLNRKGFQTLCAAKSGFNLSTKVLGKISKLGDTISPIIVGKYGNSTDMSTPYSEEISAEEADLVLYNSGPAFQKDLEFTVSAIANSGNNDRVMNALVHVSDNKIHLVSTDGHRLHKKEIAAGNYSLQLEGEHLRTVPGKIMNIFSMIPGARLTLSSPSPSKPGIEAGSITFDSEIHGEDKKCEIRFQNLSPANFPRYQHVIPYASKITFSSKVKPLIKAVRQAAKLSSEKVMYFLCDGSGSGDGDNLKLKVKVSRDGDDGDDREYVEIPVEGAAIENKFEYAIAVNPSYFIDALSGFEEVSIEFKDALSPITIKDANDKSQNDKVDNIAIVMPIRL